MAPTTLPAPTPAPPVTGAPPALAPLTGGQDGLAEVTALLVRALGGAHAAAAPAGPLPAGEPHAVLDGATDELPAALPERGDGADAALHRVAGLLTRWGLDLSHPHAAAHLQPAPLAVAVAADALASATNASLDTYDSGPATLAVERWVVARLTDLAGLGPRAGGVLTPGGSLSTLLALLLARDVAGAARGVDVRADGVAALGRPVVLAGDLAHFSVQRACSALGLGERAVLPVPTGPDRRLDVAALAAALDGLPADAVPVAVVATAGTTDFGSVDPLREVAAVAHAHGAWLHVDAAYGFPTLFSDALAPLLDGISLADSVTADLHKLGWQPAAASALLLADTDRFAPLHREAAYLATSDDAAAGFAGELGSTLQTTRRPDAVKIATTMLALGRTGLGAAVDACHALARATAEAVAADPALELVHGADLTTVVFRVVGRDDDAHAELRRDLLRDGTAVVGRCLVDGRTCLKLTLLDPATTPAQVRALLDLVLAAAGVAA